MPQIWSLITALLPLISAVLSESVIVPGAAWTDSSGNVIQAHGAGLLKVREDLEFDIRFFIDRLPLGREHLLLVRRRQSSKQRALFSGVLLRGECPLNT